jgi:hypothetical protein
MNWAIRSELKTRSAWLAIGVLIGGLSTVHPAVAQSSTYPPEVETQCKEDYLRYCSPYALGSDELRRCMEAKGMTLSSHCRQALKNAGYVKQDRIPRGS